MSRRERLSNLPDVALVVLLVVLANALAALGYLGLTTNWAAMGPHLIRWGAPPARATSAPVSPSPAASSPTVPVPPTPASGMVVNERYYYSIPSGVGVEQSARAAGAGIDSGSLARQPGPGDRVLLDLGGVQVWETAAPSEHNPIQGPGTGDKVLFDFLGLQIWEVGGE